MAAILALVLKGEEMSSAEWKEKARRWQSELLRLRNIPVAPGLLKEAKLSFQRKIKTLQAMHGVS